MINNPEKDQNIEQNDPNYAEEDKKKFDPEEVPKLKFAIKQLQDAIGQRDSLINIMKTEIKDLAIVIGKLNEILMKRL